MPCIPLLDDCNRIIGYLSVTGIYKPGDPPPIGYNDWHEWARIQYKAGLRQVRCDRCGRWRFPQEIARTEERKAVVYQTKREAKAGRNPVSMYRQLAICLDCASREKA